MYQVCFQLASHKNPSRFRRVCSDILHCWDWKYHRKVNKARLINLCFGIFKIIRCCTNTLVIPVTLFWYGVFWWLTDDCCWYSKVSVWYQYLVSQHCIGFNGFTLYLCCDSMLWYFYFARYFFLVESIVRTHSSAFELTIFVFHHTFLVFLVCYVQYSRVLVFCLLVLLVWSVMMTGAARGKLQEVTG